jgi:hypothetical protein
MEMETMGKMDKEKHRRSRRRMGRRRWGDVNGAPA